MISATDQLRHLADTLTPEEAEAYLAAPALYAALRDLIGAADRETIVAGPHKRTEGERLYRNARAALAAAGALEHDGHCTCPDCWADSQARMD